MSKFVKILQTIEIELKIPEGYTLDGNCPRHPKKGEFYLDSTICFAHEVIHEKGTEFKRWILTKDWVPPKSCPKGLFFCQDKPSPENGFSTAWNVRIGRDFIDTKLIYNDFVPPKDGSVVKS